MAGSSGSLESAAETLDSSDLSRSVRGQLESKSTGHRGSCMRKRASREECQQGIYQEGQGAETSEFECILGTLGSLQRWSSIPPGQNCSRVVLWTQRKLVADRMPRWDVPGHESTAKFLKYYMQWSEQDLSPLRQLS